MALFTPTNQKRLTNVAVVKLNVKTSKKRQKFEIACYPNKVYAWRQKLETDLDQVLQSELIYTNVSKAEVASKDSLIEAFQTSDRKKVCEIILQKGELHLTEKERQAQLESLTKDVAKIVASKTLNPTTKSCFSVGVIEKMIHDCHVNLKLNKSAKQQSLLVIRLLQNKSEIPIDVAMISAVIKLPKAQKKQVKNAVLLFCDTIVKEDDTEIKAIFEPGKYEEFRTEYELIYNIELTEIIDQNEIELENNEVSSLADNLEKCALSVDGDDDKAEADDEEKFSDDGKLNRRKKSKGKAAANKTLDKNSSTSQKVSSDEEGTNKSRRKAKKKNRR